MRRIGLFQMYDKDGIVEDYITYLLDDITKCFDEFVIIVCGEVKDEGLNKLKKYTNRIFVRDNYGFDAYAFKEAIINYLQPNELSNYDELVLFNDTFYGPFYSFKYIFDEMSNCEEDFWGLTKHAENYEFREHVQSYFLVIKKRMLCSKDFCNFWKELDIGEICFKNLVHNYEVHFTDYFDKKGYTYTTYVKDDELNTSENNYNHYACSPYTLISKYRMPIVKKKVFTESKNLFVAAGEEIQLTYDYIKDYSEYDINLIWNDLLRKYEMYDLKNNLNLNYILPDDELLGDLSIPKTVVIAHITYEELVEDCFAYLRRIPKEIDIVITSYKDSIIEKVNELSFKGRSVKAKKVQNRGRDVAAIFVACKDLIDKYEYVCFVHDKRTTGNGGMYAIGASFHELVWENMLKSEGYIRRIISLFNNEPKLGLLCPPKPLHSDYRNLNVSEWGVNFEGCLELAKKMGYERLPKKNKPPFCLSTCFWCRKEALYSLWSAGLKYEDFPEEPTPRDGALNHIVERMLVLAAQNAGYYSGIVETTKYASLDLQNREIWLRGDFTNSLKRSLNVTKFSSKYKEIYIYGAGIEAEKVKEILDTINIVVKGYIVSDKYYETCKSELKPIKKLSDIPINNDVGIIVGMNYGNTEEVRPLLINKGYTNIFYFNDKEEAK